MGLGADEAGRGALIGPLVIASFEGRPPPGVKDSKKLSKKRRENLFPKILERGNVRVVVIPPKFIDAENLNSLEAKFFSSVAPTGIVDSPEPLEKFAKRLRGHGSRAQPQHRAERYPEVAAASIIAKVVRDACMEALEKTFGVKAGSGYPSDPKTQQVWRRFSGFFRRKWKTVRRWNSRLEDYF